MKGYMLQLWNDPAFFVNAARALFAFVASGVVIFLTNPIGRTLTERIVLAFAGAMVGGVSTLPSAKKSD